MRFYLDPGDRVHFQRGFWVLICRGRFPVGQLFAFAPVAAGAPESLVIPHLLMFRWFCKGFFLYTLRFHAAQVHMADW